MSVVVTDDFNRSDAANPGANWTKAGGSTFNLRVVSNQLEANNDPSMMAYTGRTADQDGQVGITLKTLATTVGQGMGPARRVSIAANTGYFAVCYTTGITLYKVVADSYTAVGTPYSGTISTNDVIILKATGSATTALTVYQNGVSRITYSDSSSPITSGSDGAFGSIDGAIHPTGDDWYVDNLAVAAVSSRRKRVTIHPGKHPNKFGKRLRTRRDTTYNLNPVGSGAMVASAAGLGSLTATIQGTGQIVFAPAGVASSTMTIGGAGAMACSMAGIATVSAAASAGAMAVSMAGAASSALTIQGSGAISAALPGVASSSLTLSGAGALSSSPSGIASLSGALVDTMGVWRGSRRWKMPTHPGKGPLNFLKFKKSDRDKTYGLPTASGAMVASLPGTGSMVSTVTGSGAMSCAMAGTSSLTLTLAGAGALTSSPSGISSSTMTLVGAGAANTTMVGTGVMASTVAGTGSLSSNLSGVASASGTLVGSGALVTSLAGVGAMSSTLSGAGALVTAMAGVGSLQGSFVAGAMIVAMVGSGAFSGALGGSGALQGSLSGTGSFTAALVTSGAMQAVLSGSGSMTGAFPTSGETPFQILVASTLIHRAIRGSGPVMHIQGK